MKNKRLRRWLRWSGVGIVLFVILGVWIAQQFPALTSGPKTSVELLQHLFKAPIHMVANPAEYLLRRVGKEAVVTFIVSCDLPADTEGRLSSMVRGEGFEDATIPFVYYLYELYGAPVTTGTGNVADLAYAEPTSQVEAESPGLSVLVRRSLALRKHAATALKLFDALFLQVDPAARGAEFRDRYDEAAYEDIKEIFREVIDEMLSKPDDAQRGEVDENEYVAALETILDDDQRLTEFVEFFTDFIREVSDSWQWSFDQRERRKELRLAWVEQCIAGNRYYEIADYAKARAERKLAFHVAVDGLQGKLLEGLAQLSSGRPDLSGARYVSDLVDLHQEADMDPRRYEPRMPVPLGRDVLELVKNAPDRSGYLENFKKYVFSEMAQAVIVNVATVDTPAISLRNLPIIYSGHPVAGPFGTGIPNFSYLDRRTERGWYFWGSDVLHMRDIFANWKDRIPNGRKRPGPGARTLFERLWRYNTVSCMAIVDTGALEKISSEVGMAVGELKRNFIEKTIVLRFRQRAEMERKLNKRRRWLADHRKLSDSFLGSLLTRAVTLKTFRANARFLAEHEDEGLPDYVLWYNPWPDHFAHSAGPYSDSIIGYQGEYDRLDFYLGKMMEIYESVRTVDGSCSYADRTLFGVVSDHGLIYAPRVVATDELLFEAMRREGIQITYLKLTHDEGGLPTIHGSEQIKPTRPYDAVVGSTAGGSYVIDLFDIAGLEGDDEAWQRHPGYHQLRRHRLLSGQTIDWVERIQRHLEDTMDLALLREYGPGPGQRWPSEVDSVVRVVTPHRGEARIYRIRTTGNKPDELHYRYEILGEQDPLALVDSIREYLIPPDAPTVEQIRESLAQAIDSNKGHSDGRWQELLSYTIRPDVIHQFAHLYDSNRAGTINVFPLRHVGMNSGVPGRHAGEAFGEKNGTQLYWGAGLQRSRIQTARNGSLPVTLYHWLVGDEVFYAPDPKLGVSPADQLGYRSLLDEPSFIPIR